MSDVQETVQSDARDADAKDKAPEPEGIIRPLKSTSSTRGSAMNLPSKGLPREYQMWAHQRSALQNMWSVQSDSSAEAPREDSIAPKGEGGSLCGDSGRNNVVK